MVASNRAVRSEYHVGTRERAAVATYVIIAGIGLAVWATTIHAACPLIRDEMAYLWQARQIASGHLTTPIPEPAESFDIAALVSCDGRRFSRYPVGFPLALAPWVSLGVPWALNVLLGTCSLVLLFDLARRTSGRAAAWLTLALASLSPFFIAQSTTFLSHSLVLFLTLVFLHAIVRWTAAPRWGWSTVAGAAVAFAANVAPFAAAVMLLVAADAWWARRRAAAFGSACWIAFFAPIVAGGAVFGLVNHATTGSFLTPAYYLEPSVRAGFGPDVGLNGYGPLDAVANTRDRLVLLNEMLFGWPITSFLFVALLVAARIAGRSPAGALDRALWILLAGTIAAYAFWYHAGTAEGTGPRFLYSTLPALVIFSARGILVLGSAIRSLAGSRIDGARAAPPARLAGVILPAALLLLLSGAGTVPYLVRMAEDKSASERRSVRAFLEELEASDVRRGTVLVSPGSHNLGAALLYTSGFSARGDLVFAWDLGAIKNRPLLRSRSEFPLYLAQWSAKERFWRFDEEPRP